MKSKLLDFLLGYGQSEENFKSSSVASLEKTFSAKILGGMGSTFAKRIQKSKIFAFLHESSRALASARLRSYGAMILSFGFFTLLFNLMGFYFEIESQLPISAITVGAIFVAIGIPMLTAKRSLVGFLQSNATTDLIFFNIFCLRRTRNEESYATDLGLGIPIVMGIIISFIGYFITIPVTFLILSAIVFTALSFSSPEFSLMTTLFILPAIPLFERTTLTLCFLIGVCAASFLTKAAIGKRLYRFEQYDAIILLIAFFIAVSGIFNKGILSFAHALVIILLLSAYMITNNIIVNKRLADNAVNIIIFSSIPTAVYGIVKYSVSAVNPAWLDPAFSTPRADATFGNPNIYAVYLIVVIIFSGILLLDKERKRYVAFYLTSLALNLTALILTWTRGAWAALAVSAIAFVIIRSRRTPKILLLPTVMLPIAFFLLPSSVINRFISIFNLEDTSIASRLSIWRSSLDMLLDNLLLGIGIGEDAFREEFSKYAEDSVSAPHSHNLFLELGLEVGTFALVLFLFLIVIRVRHRASYAKYVRNSSVDYLCTVSGAAFFALLAFGMTDYIWYNYTMFVLFWVVFGIGSATLRISRTEYDEARMELSTDHTERCSDISISIGSDE